MNLVGAMQSRATSGAAAEALSWRDIVSAGIIRRNVFVRFSHEENV